MSRIPFVGSVIHSKMAIFGGCVEKGGKIDVVIWKIHHCTFVRNVHADLGLSWFCYWTSFGPFKADFRPKKSRFFWKNDFFDFLINRPIRPILMKNVGESWVWPVLTRIHNIGHIHNAIFAQTQFSTSHPQKWPFSKSWKFTFSWKYSICG